MAKHVIESLIDDLDGEKADESVSFGLDSKSYEIDLSSEHAQGLRDALGTFIAAGRRVTGSAATGQTRPRTGSGRSRVETAAIRDWAVQAGYKVSNRGRIPSTVVEAYMNRGSTPSANSAPTEPTPNEPPSGERPKRSRRASKPEEIAKNGEGNVTELFREAGA